MNLSEKGGKKRGIIIWICFESRSRSLLVRPWIRICQKKIANGSAEKEKNIIIIKLIFSMNTKKIPKGDFVKMYGVP